MVHAQDAHMINIYTLGMESEPNNNDECHDNNSNGQSDGIASEGKTTTESESSYEATMPAFLSCIDNENCLQNNAIDYDNPQSSPDVTIGSDDHHAVPIVDLKLNSVESTVLSSGSSRESSLSPQMILNNQHSQNDMLLHGKNVAELNLSSTNAISCSQA